MIEYLILLWLAQFAHSAPKKRDPLDSCLDVGAGLDYEPPERKRPDLRIVK